ncbi:MAG: futalosine hydrolase [Bacteroidia bacterium]
MKEATYLCAMHLLIVAATSGEVSPLLNKLEEVNVAAPFLKQYKFGSVNIDVLITGVGMTATAFHSGRALMSGHYDLAVNMGICGAFSRSLNIGETIIVAADQFSELGAEDGEQFLSAFDIRLLQKDEHPFKDGKLLPDLSAWDKILSSLRRVSALTVNKVHGNNDSIRQTLERFSPDTESMEGAAFYYACMMSDVPCIQVRAVSNYVERRNRDAWNIPLAIQSVNDVVFIMIETLS